MRSALYKILVFHILILLFQLAFRQLILDTTFVRDIGLFMMCVVFVVGKKEPYRKPNSLKTYISIYLWYGIIMSLFHVLDGADVLDVIVTYRNHFFPFILFYITVYLFQDVNYRKKWVDLLYLVFIILLVDVYLEETMNIVGVPRDILPWYKYQMAHYYRFIGSDTDAVQLSSNLESTPIIGLLGWNNVTSCCLVALLSFFLPFLLHDKINDEKSPRVSKLSKLKKILLIVFTLGAMVILAVKTPFAALALVFLLYSLLGGKKGFKSILLLTIIIVIAAFLTIGYWGEIFEKLSEETIEGGELTYIFDLSVIGGLLSAAFSVSPSAFLFGTDLTNNSMYEFLEVRVVVHTIQFGVLWLIIYILIIMSAIRTFHRINMSKIEHFDKMLATGAFLLIVSYMVDFLHYAHAMYSLHIDILAVSFAVLVSVLNTRKAKFNCA